MSDQAQNTDVQQTTSGLPSMEHKYSDSGNKLDNQNSSFVARGTRTKFAADTSGGQRKKNALDRKFDSLFVNKMEMPTTTKKLLN